MYSYIIWLKTQLWLLTDIFAPYLFSVERTWNMLKHRLLKHTCVHLNIHASQTYIVNANLLYVNHNKNACSLYSTNGLLVKKLNIAS